ncbi:MAG: peptidoglycan-binding protein [Candidatus Pacebacteria bacterium]|nr:peptidoglycan-binding protein [Candidatus Paceibacterota bacterium]
MIKKILLSLALFGFVFGSPILANAQSFTNLKAQLFDLSSKIENFKKVESSGEVLGATSSYDLSFTAEKYNVPYNGATKFWWIVSPAAQSCIASSSHNNYQWDGSKNPNSGPYGAGQAIGLLTQNESFHLECTWADGTKKKQTIFIQIEDNLPKITFTATPSLFPYSSNDSTTLAWSTTQATKCSWGGDDIDDDQWRIPKDKGLQGSKLITDLDRSAWFKINCEGPGGYKSAEVRVEFIPDIKFTANPTTVPYLGNTTLNWNADEVYATNTGQVCKASKDWSGNKQYKGSQIISGIKNDKTFVLTCYSASGTEYSKSVTVKVIRPDDKDKTPTEPVPTGGNNTNIVSNSNTNNICSFTFTKDLAYGSSDSVKNKDVSLMQSVLVDEGLLSSKDATGKFYSVTQTALKKFQKKYGLSQTGKVDQKTRIKLNELFPIYCNQ